MTQASSWACSTTSSPRLWSLCLVLLIESLSPRQAATTNAVADIKVCTTTTKPAKLFLASVLAQCLHTLATLLLCWAPVLHLCCHPVLLSPTVCQAFGPQGAAFRRLRRLHWSWATSLMRPSASKSASCGRSLSCAGRSSFWVRLVVVSLPYGRP